MTYSFLTCMGRDHMLHSGSNEDRVRIVSHDGVTTAVVCDGAGSFRAGSDAAAKTADILTELLHRRFRELCTAPSADARKLICEAVETSLHSLSRRMGIAAQELACTILATAVHTDGRCLCVHLGDGIILQKDKGNHRPSVVSCPMTGLVPHSTYLTMNCDLDRYLRFYRWESDCLEQLLLLSDGAAEHLVRLQGGDGWVYTAGEMAFDAIRTRLLEANPRDDHSVVLISRKQEKEDTPQ